MKLRHIHIRNFRSIKECDLSIDKVMALVGENNSGKSAVLRALNAFFNFEEEEADFINGKHLYSAKTKPVIRLTFDGEISEFADETTHDHLIVEVCFNKAKRTVKVKSDGRFKMANESVIEKINKRIDYYFIPPIRDHKNLEWAASTVFRRLAEDFLYKATEKRDNYTPKFKTATDYLESNGFDRLAKYIRDMYNVKSRFSFRLAFRSDMSFLDFIGGLRFLVDEKNAVHEIAECGTGVQSLTIIALHRGLAAINGKNVILGLEEPETNLHPQAQREVIRSLKRHVEDAADKVDQVIFTTHSTILIDSVDHTEVVLVRKVDDTSRGIRTTVTQLPENFYVKHGLEEFRYYQFHRYRNSEFFYSRLVVVAESKNDAQAIQELMRSDGFELDDLGVSVLSLDGVDNIRYAASLIKDLRLPSLFVVDKDFFLPYEKDRLDDSRDPRGFPKYRKEYRRERMSAIQMLIPHQKDRDDLLTALFTNHTAALDILAKHDVVCMKWALEIDLANSEKGLELLCDECGIPEARRDSKSLLVDNVASAKKIDKIVAAIRKLPKRNYPHSFSKICKLLGQKLSAME